LEILARAGAFDQLDPNRRRVFQSLDPLVAYSAAIHDQRASNQVSLFGEAGDDLPEPRLSPVEDWEPAERLAEEFTAIGFYLSGHPLDDYMTGLKRRGVMTLEEVTALAERQAAIAKMAGTVAGRQERKSARGNRFAFVQLSDPTGNYEVTMFSDTLETARDHLETGAKVIVQVEATMEAAQLKLLGRSVEPIRDDGAGLDAGALHLFVENEQAIGPIAAVLDRAAQGARGKGAIRLTLMDKDLPGEVEVELPGDWPVGPKVRGALKSLPGVFDVVDG
jgi:DNA polymerase-3 subunit alpha